MPRIARSLATDPPPYGGISVEANTVPTTITTAAVARQFLLFSTNDPSFNLTPDHTNDHITVGITGDYLITGSIVVESVAGGAQVAHIEVKKNNGATDIMPIHAHRRLAGGGGDKGSVSLSGIANVSQADTVELWITNDSATGDFIISDASLSMLRVG